MWHFANRMDSSCLFNEYKSNGMNENTFGETKNSNKR